MQWYYYYCPRSLTNTIVHATSSNITRDSTYYQPPDAEADRLARRARRADGGNAAAPAAVSRHYSAVGKIYHWSKQ